MVKHAAANLYCTDAYSDAGLPLKLTETVEEILKESRYTIEDIRRVMGDGKGGPRTRKTARIPSGSERDAYHKEKHEAGWTLAEIAKDINLSEVKVRVDFSRLKFKARR